MIRANGKPTDLAKTAADRGIRVLVLIELRDDTPSESRDSACQELAAVHVIDATQGVEVEQFPYAYPAQGPCAQGLAQAARDLFGSINDVLQRHGLAGALGSAALFVEFGGVHGYARFQELQAYLRNRPNVQAADLDSFRAGGWVTFRVIYAGPAPQLADDLVKSPDAGFRLKYLGQQGNLLRFTVE